MHKTSGKKGIRQLHTIYPEHAEMLVKLVEGPHGFGSGSDVVRKAIVEIYNSFYPPYKGPTYRQAKKEQEQQAEASVTDEQYCINVLHGVILQNPAGKQYVLLHQIGNSILTIPVEGIKSWAAKHPPDVEHHLNLISERSIEDVITPFHQQLITQATGIVFPPPVV